MFAATLAAEIPKSPFENQSDLVRHPHFDAVNKKIKKTKRFIKQLEVEFPLPGCEWLRVALACTR